MQNRKENKLKGVKAQIVPVHTRSLNISFAYCISEGNNHDPRWITRLSEF